jgi:hypothetical protein
MCIYIYVQLARREIISASGTFFMLVSSLIYASTVKMEAVCSFETSVGFHMKALCHNGQCGNLKSYIMLGLRLFAGCLRVLLFNPEDEGDIFLQNIS